MTRDPLNRPERTKIYNLGFNSRGAERKYPMRTFITPNENGYELRILNDDGTVFSTTPLTNITHDGKSYILPDNPANRHYWALSRLDGKEVELTYKESKTFGPRTTTDTPKTSTKGWIEYLTEEEKALYDELKAKAEKRAKIAQLKAQKAEWERQLAELEAQA